mmetsp:Transcript_995/g.1315  ORF Transcript_995/g.1315 Transcript_995/m.1315 type:complete len:414 (-) Transcript_995:351-1592(-)
MTITWTVALRRSQSQRDVKKKRQSRDNGDDGLGSGGSIDSPKKRGRKRKVSIDSYENSFIDLVDDVSVKKEGNLKEAEVVEVDYNDVDELVVPPEWMEEHASIGMKVAAFFPDISTTTSSSSQPEKRKKRKDQPYVGTVTKYCPASRKGVENQKYRILWENGDEQDFDENEFLEGVVLLNKLAPLAEDASNESGDGYSSAVGAGMDTSLQDTSYDFANGMDAAEVSSPYYHSTPTANAVAAIAVDVIASQTNDSNSNGTNSHENIESHIALTSSYTLEAAKGDLIELNSNVATEAATTVLEEQIVTESTAAIVAERDEILPLSVGYDDDGILVLSESASIPMIIDDVVDSDKLVLDDGDSINGLINDTLQGNEMTQQSEGEEEPSAVRKLLQIVHGSELLDGAEMQNTFNDEE